MDWCLAYAALMSEQEMARLWGGVPRQLPVLLRGYRRQWTVASSRRYMCLKCGGEIGRQPVSLDLVQHREGLLPAVLLETDASMLQILDQEYQDYERHPLDPALLMGWAATRVPQGDQIWVYQGLEARNISLAFDWKRPFQPAPYKYLCLRATKRWGSRFAVHSHRNTRPCPFPVMDQIEFAPADAELVKCRCYKI